MIMPKFVLTTSDNVTVLQSWSSRNTFASVTDGLSNTLLIGEKFVPLGQFGFNWVAPPPWTTTSNPPANPADGAIYNAEFPWVYSRIAGPLNPLAQTIWDSPLQNFGSAHPGVCQFVFADGSVHALPVTIDPGVLGRLASRNDGQAISDF
jgi:prepilin-type processing-associated H-X9-DG protein